MTRCNAPDHPSQPRLCSYEAGHAGPCSWARYIERREEERDIVDELSDALDKAYEAMLNEDISVRSVMAVGHALSVGRDAIAAIVRLRASVPEGKRIEGCAPTVPYGDLRFRTWVDQALIDAGHHVRATLILHAPEPQEGP